MRTDRRAGVNLGYPIDHDFTVEQMHAWLHDDGIADVDAGHDDAQAMQQSGDDRNPVGLQPSLRPVEDLSEEGVAFPCEPERLEGESLPRGSPEGAAAVAGGDSGVGKDGAHEPRVPSAHHPLKLPLPDAFGDHRVPWGFSCLPCHKRKITATERTPASPASSRGALGPTAPCYLRPMFDFLRGRSRRSQTPPTSAPTELLRSVRTLTEANRKQRSPELDREILELRHRAGLALLDGGGMAPAPLLGRSSEPEVGDGGLASIAPDRLDAATLRGSIREHGYLLSRGVVRRDEAEAMAERIEAAFADRAAGGTTGFYEEFRPKRPSPPIADRAWIEAGGGVLAADAPAVAFELFELIDRSGLGEVVEDYLQEPVTIAIQKCTLRRADPSPPGGWHQDGSFMGDTRAINVWIPLSDCGVDAPGLDFVPRRIDEVLDTGMAGSGAEHLDDSDGVSPKSVLIAPSTVERAAGDSEVVRPAFSPGDVMLFDDRFLHRTGSSERMVRPRYAIECWFFGASGFPGDYAPLAL